MIDFLIKSAICYVYNFFIMNDDISYVWVTKGDSIPHTEKTYGILNIINTAQQNLDSQINVYVDSEQKQISYTLSPNIEQPKNIKFIPVLHLVEECKNKALKNKHNSKFIDEAYQLYLLEMAHGHPAYAGNFIKLLALYKGGFVSDIGVIYGENIFLDIQGNGMIKTNDDKFHSATPPVLFWSSDNEINSVLQAIKDINSSYNGEGLLRMFKNMIAGNGEKYTTLKQNISKIYHKHGNSATSFIQSAKLCLDLDLKLQDLIYGDVIGRFSKTYCFPKQINHKMSHLITTHYNEQINILESRNSALDKSSKGPKVIKRTASNDSKQFKVRLKELERRKSFSGVKNEYYDRITPIGGTQFGKF
jgi:hypothetical protein